MVVEARIRFRHDGCYSLSLSEAVRVTHLSGDAKGCLCLIESPDPALREHALSLMSHWLDWPAQVLDRSGNGLLLRCNCPTRGLTPLLLDWGATVLWPVVHTAGWESWHLLAPTGEVMARVLEELGKRGTVEVESLKPATAAEAGVYLPVRDLTRQLSRGQMAALALALNRGYYASPRKVTLDELAREAGLARSTFQEHLQKAEALVMSHLGEMLTSHDQLLGLAARGPGRPPRTS